MLLAGKVTNDANISLRDVINISHRVLRPSVPPLEISELTYDIREGLSRLELFVLRELRFRLEFEHPHQELIQQLATLRDWRPNDFQEKQLDTLAATILQDIYVCPNIIVDHSAKTIAMVVISAAFAAAKIDLTDEEWINVINKYANPSKIERLKKIVLRDVYRISDH
jgi:hypothetical protein